MATEATEPTTEPAAAARGARKAYADLFWISFLILFFELACIRWFASTVLFLTFFTNLVLLACFLGMSVGLMSARRRQDLVRAVFPLALVAVSCAVVTSTSRVSRRYVIAVGGRASPQQVFFGTEGFLAADPSRFVVPVEAVAGAFFGLIALSFVGLGQVMGRAFHALPNRVAAYSVDVLGSLSGIAAFGLLSWLWTPPPLWFAVVLLVGMRFLPRLSWWQGACAAGLLTVLGVVGYREGRVMLVTWSPYYKVQYAEKLGRIQTNNIGHQQMVNVGESGAAYFLPHLLNRDAGNAPFGEVMVIGAGSGNDVAAALTGGARHVDAVEIEPVLNAIGRADHPLKPFDDPRVAVIIDDGRSAVRRSRRSYDLVAYALLDSLVLHSGYSSLRLESFLFTDQAFEDVKARLGDDGVFVMYNYFRQGWIVGRLAAMAERVFKTKPVVIALPYRPTVRAGDSLLGDNFTLVVAGKPGSKALEGIRKRFESRQSFWLSERPDDNLGVNGYGPGPPRVAGVPPGRWQKIAPADVDTAGVGPLPTDDWPFLYLRSATVPALNLRGMAIVAALSLAILLAFAPVRTVRPDARMFFLGAGFMLLETKGVVHLALLFGSTWVVNSVVFAAILVMILVSNLFVLAFQPQRLGPYYAGLIAALLVNAFVPMDVFLGLPGSAKVVASCAVVFVPVFFAGVIFASAFARSRNPDVDFGSNVAGIILGGLSENASLVLGFDLLLLLAVGYYVLSAVLGPRLPAPR
jgi:hypothetical protein